MEQEYHQMILEEVRPSGEEAWHCPTCGRRLSVVWEPKFKKKVVAAGDENAAHSGGKGIFQIESTQLSTREGYHSKQEPLLPIEDPSLAPWAAWLDEVGFDNLWNNEA